MKPSNCGAIGLLPEVQLHRPPVFLVQPRLERGLEAHEDEVTDQVGLAQLLARRVHAFEDELRVVLVAAERNVHHHQLGEAATDRGEVALLRGEQRGEEVEVLRHPQRRILRMLRALDDGLERGVVGLREQQLEVAVAGLQRVAQVVMAQLGGGEAVDRFIITQRAGQCLDQQ